MKSLLFFLLAITFLPGFSQTMLVPGKNVFEKKWVTNNTTRMGWYVVADTSRFEVGEITTETVVNDKQVIIVTRVNMKNSKAPWTDSTIADIATLKPVRHASYNAQRDMVLEFGKVVTGYYFDKLKKANTVISDTTRTGYFDSNIYPALLGWLPLSEGYHQDINIYDFNPAAKSGILKASVNTVKSGTYSSAHSGTRNVWIVSVSDEIGNGGNGTSTYYFDKADRKLWKQEIEANGRKLEMLLKE